MLRVYKAYSEYVSGVAAAHGSHPSALLDAGKMFPFSFGSAMKNSDVPKLGCSAFVKFANVASQCTGPKVARDRQCCSGRPR